MAQETARFYTRSRRFPKMIGRMNDGSRIPGGPYTLTQVGVGGAVLLIMLVMRGLVWSTGEILLDLLVTAALAFAVTWLIGRLPMTRRNLLFAFLDAAAATFKPFSGKYQGQVIRLAAPHLAGGASHRTPQRHAAIAEGPAHTVAVTSHTSAKTGVDASPRVKRTASTPALDPAARPRPLTGVERLLAQVNATPN